MNPEMTPEQAVDLINQLREKFQATGKEHDLLRTALLVISKALLAAEKDPK